MENLNKFNESVDVRIALAQAAESKRDEAFWTHVKHTEAYFRAAALFSFLVLLVVVFYGIFRIVVELNVAGYLNEFKVLIYNILISAFGKVLLILLILSIGLALFFFKRKQQMYYGLAETAFALVSCLVVTENMQKNIAKQNDTIYILLSGMTTIYLIVRGLSNIFEGWNKSFFLKETISEKDGWKDFIFKITENK